VLLIDVLPLFVLTQIEVSLIEEKKPRSRQSGPYCQKIL